MRVAAVQFCPVFRDQAGNIKRLAGLITRAAQNGAKLVVLPELCTTGYSFMSRAEAEPYAEVLEYPSTAPNSSFRVFRALALKYSIHIVWGLVEKGVGVGNLFNSQVLMCPDGTFEAYQKINRFANDWLWATQGRASPPVRSCTVDGRQYRIGLLICRDVRDKSDEHASLYEPGDADVVAFSASWGDGGFPATAWLSFAKNNKATLVVSNRYGQEQNNDFGEGGGLRYPPGSIGCL